MFTRPITGRGRDGPWFLVLLPMSREYVQVQLETRNPERSRVESCGVATYPEVARGLHRGLLLLSGKALGFYDPSEAREPLRFGLRDHDRVLECLFVHQTFYARVDEALYDTFAAAHNYAAARG